MKSLSLICGWVHSGKANDRKKFKVSVEFTFLRPLRYQNGHDNERFLQPAEVISLLVWMWRLTKCSEYQYQMMQAVQSDPAASGKCCLERRYNPLANGATKATKKKKLPKSWVSFVGFRSSVTTELKTDNVKNRASVFISVGSVSSQWPTTPTHTVNTAFCLDEHNLWVFPSSTEHSFSSTWLFVVCFYRANHNQWTVRLILDTLKLWLIYLKYSFPSI